MLLEELKAVNSTYSCFTRREAPRNNRIFLVLSCPTSRYPITGLARAAEKRQEDAQDGKRNSLASSVGLF
jgi:hypothetical protein